nr:hypothetical protein BaRGS_016443 [Batillaria attramentaria]KAG5698699.1 hypothetical protein BaRGS_022587 [Batillaria attramentaria]
MMPSPARACRLFLAAAAVFGSFPDADATNAERVTVPENFRLQRLVNEGTYGRPGAYLFKLYYTGTTKPAAYLYRAFAAPAELVEHELGVVQIVLWNNETVDAELDLHLPDVTYSFRFSALSQWIPRGENLPDFSLRLQSAVPFRRGVKM